MVEDVDGLKVFSAVTLMDSQPCVTHNAAGRAAPEHISFREKDVMDRKSESADILCKLQERHRFHLLSPSSWPCSSSKQYH